MKENMSDFMTPLNVIILRLAADLSKDTNSEEIQFIAKEMESIVKEQYEFII